MASSANQHCANFIGTLCGRCRLRRQSVHGFDVVRSFIHSLTPPVTPHHNSRSVAFLERLPCTSQTTVAFCRTLAVAHCGLIPMTRGSCSCREHITNSVIGVSRPPILDCGTTFHLDYGGWDLPSTPSDNLWKLIYLVTEALSDSFECIGAI